MSISTAIGRVLFVVYVVFGGVKEADAWVEGYQPFPEGEATVVLHAFCRSQFCGDDFPVSGWSDERWVNMIQDAIAEWNDAGANFTFRTREVRPTDDPCDIPGAVAVILAPASSTCPGDGGAATRAALHTVGTRCESISVCHGPMTIRVIPTESWCMNLVTWWGLVIQMKPDRTYRPS